MNSRLSQCALAIILPALALLATASAQAAVITLTGGDAADASDGIGYAPSGTLVEAYRMTASNTAYVGAADQSAHTYKGITFQPFLLNGGPSAQAVATTTQGTVTITNGFFYPAGVGLNIGSGGGALSSDDTALWNVAKYQSFATSGNYLDNHGTQTLTLSGLVQGKTYQVDVFAGSVSSGDEYWYTMTGDSGALPTDRVVPTNARAFGIAYDVRENVVADINGQITVSVTDNLATNDNATINAFSVSQIEVPEPASMALLGVGMLAVMTRRRVRA